MKRYWFEILNLYSLSIFFEIIDFRYIDFVFMAWHEDQHLFHLIFVDQINTKGFL